MNWKNLEFTDFKINQKTGKKYHQRYLAPSYYLELHLRYTDIDEISQFYDEVLDTLGVRFTYHHNNKKRRESKFKDKDAAFRYFTDFLKSDNTYCWFKLANAGGIGNATEIGGVADASFEAWLHKVPKTEEEKIERLNRYLDNLKEFKTEMLPNGITISQMNVSFPMDAFETSTDFKNWVWNTKIIKEGAFFSGSAGYRINTWKGYVNTTVQNKLGKILKDYPGLDADISIGNSMGRFLNEDKSDIIPVIKRLNWLNFISDEGLALLGDFDVIKAEIEKSGISTIHHLKNGACIQVSDQLAISEDDDNFSQYVVIQNSIKKIMYKSHSRDTYWCIGNDDSVVKEWLYKYNASTSK